MRISRGLRLAVALGLFATAAACGGGGGEAGGSGDKVELTLLSHYSDGPSKEGLDKMIQQWNKENPKVQVKAQVVKFDDLLTTMTVRQTGGRGADIVSAYGLWGGQLMKANVVAKVPDDIATKIKAEYSPAALGAVTTGDTLLGYPTELNTYVLFYNKKILAAAGISKPPTTWAELADAAKKTVQRDAKGNIQVEGLSLIQDGDNKSVHPFLSLLDAAGGKFLGPDGTAQFDNAEGKAALKFEADLAAAKATNPSIMPTKQFRSGGVAMAIQAGWWIGSLKTQMKDKYSSDVGVTAIPGPTAGSKGSLAYGFFMGVNQRSKHADDAWKFLTWMNEHKAADGQVTETGKWLADQGLIPPRTADQAAYKQSLSDPNLAPIYDAATYAMAEPNQPGAYEAKTALHNAIMGVLADGKNPDDALAQAAKAVKPQ
ncbi:multiple sugar transport system substrate-binding protein [Kribbella sp. VKM Ac-2571]|uniref:extracellular solute-binding protein n=1 Tax=Kribbella sp. VKM Ac-2571 TaxID=2512222 RepID=UPI00105E661D|nr:extracellular solute-binding protein [Kribbella sp. VKM Ac-2571]TDO46530.1 multiple sugar transport system substrate-binding protein [Kribbella sp. VKM Ac-2571]